jgi:glutamine amidotransferase
VLERLRAGLAMGDALAATIAAVSAAGGTGRFNFLLTDGQSIAATACGDTLWYRQADREPARQATGAAPGGSPAPPPAASVVVASEPFDDEPGWVEVPDRHLLAATERAVSVRPLAPGARDQLPERSPAVAAGTVAEG